MTLPCARAGIAACKVMITYDEDGWDDTWSGWDADRSRGQDADRSWGDDRSRGQDDTPQGFTSVDGMSWQRAQRVQPQCMQAKVAAAGCSDSGRDEPEKESYYTAEPLDDPPTAVGAAPEIPLDLPDRVPYYSLEYFRSYAAWSGTFKLHSIALKYFRDQAEAAGATVVTFPFADSPVVVDLPISPGMPWVWQEMVAQMDDASIEYVVQGEGDHRSRGLVSCTLEQLDKYDVKRAHQNPALKPMPRIWDFVLTRDDGSKVSVHPTFTSTEIELTNYTAVRYRGTSGGTSGRGPVQYFVQTHVARILRFDPQKKPGSRAVSSGHSGSQKHSGTRMIFEPESQGQPAASSGSGTTR